MNLHTREELAYMQSLPLTMKIALTKTRIRELKTTGCQRTGCVLCGFGCHLKDDTRFVDLKQTHPGLYGLMDKISNNGVTMREAIDWINEHGNLDIKY